jgi:hypothetical protein
MTRWNLRATTRRCPTPILKSKRAAALLAALLLSTAAPRPVHAQDLASLLAAHEAAVGATVEFFREPTRVEQIDTDLATGDRVSFHWQQGRYREEYRWLGFTEVFAYDGSRHWYGSTLALPYGIDQGSPPSVTIEAVRALAYLAEPWRSHLTVHTAPPPAGVTAPAVLRFAPPEMGEALLLLRKDGLLEGVLTGDRHTLAASHVFTLTRFEDWRDFHGVRYPALLRNVTMDESGTVARERESFIQNVVRAEALPDTAFTPAGAPSVPAPALPQVPYTIEMAVTPSSIVVPVTAPNGEELLLALDTGANIGLLRGDVAEQLGLRAIGTEQISGHGGSAQVGYLRAAGFRLGEVELPAWPAVVMHEDGSGSKLDRELGYSGIDGLLGCALLQNFVVRIDYPRKRLSLYPRNGFDASILKADYSFPLHRERLPYVDVVVDGRIRGGAYFNTGARYGFALSFWAIDEAGITYPVESMGRGITVGGSSMFGVIRPRRVVVPGPIGTRELVLESPATNLELLAPGEPPLRSRIASFGNALLADYAVTFDLAREMVYLERE